MLYSFSSLVVFDSPSFYRLVETGNGNTLQEETECRSTNTTVSYEVFACKFQVTNFHTTFQEFLLEAASYKLNALCTIILSKYLSNLTRCLFMLELPDARSSFLRLRCTIMGIEEHRSSYICLTATLIKVLTACALHKPEGLYIFRGTRTLNSKGEISSSLSKSTNILKN